MSRLARDRTAEPVSRDQILRPEREQGSICINFPCSADHVQDWQPYPVDPYYVCLYVCMYVCMYVYTMYVCIHIYNVHSHGQHGGYNIIQIQQEPII